MTWAELDMLLTVDPDLRRPEPAKPTGTAADLMSMAAMRFGVS